MYLDDARVPTTLEQSAISLWYEEDLKRANCQYLREPRYLTETHATSGTITEKPGTNFKV